MRTDERKEHDSWVEKLADPHWFVPGLTITTKTGKKRPMAPLFPEQVECIDAFQSSTNILVEKPRQIGSTTVWVALFFWRMLTCGDEYDVLAVMHDHSSVSRFTRQVRRHIEYLPRGLRPIVVRAGDKEVTFKVGRNESSFITTMAGGRGQARSRTFRGGLLSEAGRYPTGSSAQGGRGALDEEAYASFDSTMPPPNEDPLVRQIIESTPGKPAGLYYDLVKSTQEPEDSEKPDMLGGDYDWKFMFFPWYRFPQYQMPWNPAWTLDVVEKELLTKYGPQGMTRENLAFRRYKLYTKRIKLPQFRTEFPTSWDEPFLLATSMWFNLDIIKALRAKAPKGGETEGLRVYHRYEPGHLYYIGMDAAGGTGGDDAVIDVTRDDGEQCAVWSSNTTDPWGQADQTANVSVMFGGAVANVEVGNKWGKAVRERCETLGVPLWTDDDGNPFVTDDRTKAGVMTWTKQLLEHGHAPTHDAVTLAQCDHIREQPRTHRIEADQGYHDDHVVGRALGLWAARASITARWQQVAAKSKLVATGPNTFDLAAERAELERRMLGKGKPWKR